MPLDRVLVIGCGYLGSRVGAALLRRGTRVTATTRRPERLDELREQGFEPALLELAAPEASAAWISRPGAAVYCVSPGPGGDAKLAFRRGPALAAERILEAGGPAPSRFVLVSSTGVYAPRDGSWVDETSPGEPTDERHRALRAGEEDVLRLARERGLHAVVVRLAGLYGPGRSPGEWLRRPGMHERVLRGGREAWMNWVRVEDAAEAAVLALERGRAGEVYLVSDGSPVRRGDFYREAARLAGLPPPELPSDPRDLGKRCSIEKARQELGYEPRYPSWREGLANI
ncbi:MAG: NAD-dependent epimerase/dehydratase family protein [Planctomycetes bacterium]|nr:NAD-dependent epimerase/dehydratase family protein [Planctomycetota bacterium]